MGRYERNLLQKTLDGHLENLGNLETKKPRNFETKKVRNQETKKLSTQKTKEPRNQEPTLPLNVPTSPLHPTTTQGGYWVLQVTNHFPGSDRTPEEKGIWDYKKFPL